jgi:exodeoxyribonuclease VII small subunit
MTDTYAAAKEQLDDIVAQVRKKDVSLERSLDLLEEGVALANRCTELIDQAAWEDLSDDEDSSEEVELAEVDALIEAEADATAEVTEASEAIYTDETAFVEVTDESVLAGSVEQEYVSDNPEVQTYTEEAAGDNEPTTEYKDA